MPGVFHTNAHNVADSQIPPNSHPAYSDPDLPSVTARNGIRAYQVGDVNKAAQIIKRLEGTKKPPLFLPLGKDAIGMYETSLEILEKELEEAKVNWASNLERDD